MLHQKATPARQEGGQVHRMKKADNGILPLGNYAGGSRNGSERQHDAPRDRPAQYDAPAPQYDPYSEGLPPAKEDYNPYRYDQYESDAPAKRNLNAASEEDEFQRRIEEYRRAEANLAEAQLGNSGPDMDANNPYPYQNDFPQYGRNHAAYQPQDDDHDRIAPRQDFEPYGREPDQGYPHPSARDDNPYKKPVTGTGGDKIGQRNYLVNNPIAPDAPQKRAPGGFRAHQEITHDSMGIDRPNKIAVNQGTAADAYNNIKKKYGNHSTQFNILTGV